VNEKCFVNQSGNTSANQSAPYTSDKKTSSKCTSAGRTYIPLILWSAFDRERRSDTEAKTTG
jgi:hypothetical protein